LSDCGLRWTIATKSTASSVGAGWRLYTSRRGLKHQRRIALKVLRPGIALVRKVGLPM
jgi:hypothetical protein